MHLDCKTGFYLTSRRDTRIAESVDFRARTSRRLSPVSLYISLVSSDFPFADRAGSHDLRRPKYGLFCSSLPLVISMTYLCCVRERCCQAVGDVRWLFVWRLVQLVSEYKCEMARWVDLGNFDYYKLVPRELQSTKPFIPFNKTRRNTYSIFMYKNVPLSITKRQDGANTCSTTVSQLFSLNFLCSCREYCVHSLSFLITVWDHCQGFTTKGELALILVPPNKGYVLLYGDLSKISDKLAARSLTFAGPYHQHLKLPANRVILWVEQPSKTMVKALMEDTGAASTSELFTIMEERESSLACRPQGPSLWLEL